MSEMGPEEITRRRFLAKSGIVLGAAALAPVLPEPIVRRLGGGLWLPAAQASPGVVLDPHDPVGSGFQPDGTESFTPGDVLTLNDTSVGGFIGFFANDADAGPTLETDVVATFQSDSSGNGADADNWLVINDGLIRSAIAACVIKNNVRGIGLYSSGQVSDPDSYPVFVPNVNWFAAPVTVRLRRAANGDAEIVEIDGVAPTPRALLAADQCPPPTRAGATVEFGAFGIVATATVEYAAFRSERVIPPVAGTLSFTSFRLRDPDSTDRIQFRADYTLGSGSDGIDPAAEPVTIKLSTPAGGQFYPAPGVNPLNGFDVRGSAPRRRWTLNDSERARTGIEQFVLDEDPDNSGGVSFRDGRTSLADADYSTVNVEITIGTGATQDRLTGTANLVQKPAGSGSWRLG
jgi:hypothetical protein